MPSRWNETRPLDQAWRPQAGLSRAARAAEQDEAAGGRDRRRIALPGGGHALASVYLRLPTKSRRIYAYIRWSDCGKTVERYVCQVDDTSRAANLVAAWRVFAERGIAETSDDSAPNARQSWASSDAVRAVMRANKGRDTRPERALRSALHARGLRYRVNARPLPEVRRTADVVFPGQRIAVFLDGCFWHGCSEHHRPASKNSEFWSSKVEGTKARDADTDRQLTQQGWTTIRVWEHEDPNEAAERIENLVLDYRRSPQSG
jgi:DNA mismatch endonuclease (patch repair protein)